MFLQNVAKQKTKKEKLTFHCNRDDGEKKEVVKHCMR